MRRILLAAWIVILAAVPAFAQSGYRTTGPRNVTAANQVITLDISGMGSGSIEVADSFTGTLTFEVSTTGGGFTAIQCNPPNSTSKVTSTTAVGNWGSCSVAGYGYLRVKAGSSWSGIASVTLSASVAGGGSSGDVTLGDVMLTAGAQPADDPHFVRCSDGSVAAACVVSGTVTANLSATDNAVLDDIADGIPVTNAGTFAVQVSSISAGNNNIGDVDVASIAAGNNNIGDVDVASIAAGDNNIGNVDIVTMPGTGVEDAAQTAGGTLIMMGTVRRDSAASSAGTDGDNATLNTDASGNLYVTGAVSCSNCSGTGVSVNEDVASANADPGTPAYTVRQDTAAGSTSTDGDYQPLKSDSVGRLYVNATCSNCSGSGVSVNEDVASAGADPGTPAYVIRSDTLGSTTSTNGDYMPLKASAVGGLWVTLANSAGTELTPATDQTLDGAIGTTGPLMVGRGSTATPSAMSADGDATAAWLDLNGRLHIKGETTEDTASANADYLLAVAAIRDDTLDARSGTEGDYEPFHLNANGALWTIDVNSAAMLTSLQLTDDIVGVEDAGESAGGGLARMGSVRRDVAASSAGTTGDNATVNTDALGLTWARFLDPCSGVAKVSFPVNIATATTTVVVAASASNKFYLCEMDLVAAGADNVALVEDATGSCASPDAGISGGTTAGSGYNLAANGGLAKGSGLGTVGISASTNVNVCLITSAGVQLSGTIVYALAP